MWRMRGTERQEHNMRQQILNVNLCSISCLQHSHISLWFPRILAQLMKRVDCCKTEKLSKHSIIELEIVEPHLILIYSIDIGTLYKDCSSSSDPTSS